MISALVLGAIDLAEQSVATCFIHSGRRVFQITDGCISMVLPHCGFCLHPIGCAELNENQHIRSKIRPAESDLL
jgi:hypothetical protein